MKRKRVKLKTKIKGLEQFKNLAIAILAVVILFVVISATRDYFKIGDSEAATPPGPQRASWPTFAIQPTKTVEPSISRTNPGPDAPGPSDIQTPYAFVQATGNNSYGPVYYSPGPIIPSVIFSGDCAIPVPSGNYVFCIRVDAKNLDGDPIRATPIKIDVNSGVVTDLAPPRDAPRMWDSLVPADAGRDYIYGAISRGVEDWGTGPLYIVNDGVQVYSTFGSYMFPTLSDDGTMASWCYDDDPNIFGDRDFYAFDIATQTATKVHDVDDNAECESGDFSNSGVRKSVAWLVKINTPGEGWRDSQVWQANRELTGAWRAGIQVNDNEHRWNGPPLWSPKPKYLIWASNPDPYVFAGYSIWGAFEGNPSQKVEITRWNPNRQDLWPDVDGDGTVIYGRDDGAYHYIPIVTYFGEYASGESIRDFGNVCRDYRFAN